MNKNLIEIKNISKNFKNNNSNINVLKNINLNLQSGKLVALMGPSGSGKSTFLHLIALLDKPTKGQISVMGKKVENLKEDEKNFMLRNNISIIFQNNNLLSDFTSLENVAIPLIIRGNSYYQIVLGQGGETLGTWEAAEAKAVEIGGHLVTINDADENAWLHSEFNIQGRNPSHLTYWTGLRDTNSDGSKSNNKT